MPRACYESCPVCDAEFRVEIDEEGFPYSTRCENECECGETVYCQECNPQTCAACDKPLCESCGGNDLDGEHFCSECLPRPEITLTPLAVAAMEAGL